MAPDLALSFAGAFLCAGDIIIIGLCVAFALIGYWGSRVSFVLRPASIIIVLLLLHVCACCFVCVVCF